MSGPHLATDVPTSPVSGASARPAAVSIGRARASRWLRIAFVVLVLGGASAWLLVAFRQATRLSGLTAELRDRGTIAVIGDAELLALEVEGSTFVPTSSVRGLDRALRAGSMADVSRVMGAGGVRGLLVGTQNAPSGQSVHARLARYEAAPPLGGVFLSPGAALYEKVELPTLDDADRSAVGHIARRILMGSRPPSFRSFPEEMRRDMGIEVMVLIRERGSPLLWRSARRGSLARGVVDASLAARDRWAVRESFLGGTVTARLPALDLELHAVLFDGRLGDRTPPFLRRALRLGTHGVGFERRGDWRYVLPEIAHSQAHGEAIGAVRALLADNGLPTDDVDRSELVLYRFSLVRLATSPPERRPATQ